MSSHYHSEIAVPIETPIGISACQKTKKDFTFDQENRFTDYTFERNESTYTVSEDDRGQWYFFASFLCETLDQLKLSRQIFRPDYLKEESLPLVELLEELHLTPINEGHDKAYGHALYFVPSLNKIPTFHQARLANYDGTDDPTIIKQIHFIENEYKSEKTRFIAGFETRSFATLTENKTYAEEVHLPHNARTYLKLFLYFSRYDTMPSQQMMPRFLANLWASTMSLKTKANPALFQTEFIE